MARDQHPVTGKFMATPKAQIAGEVVHISHVGHEDGSRKSFATVPIKTHSGMTENQKAGMGHALGAPNSVTGQPTVLVPGNNPLEKPAPGKTREVAPIHPGMQNRTSFIGDHAASSKAILEQSKLPAQVLISPLSKRMKP